GFCVAGTGSAAENRALSDTFRRQKHPIATSDCAGEAGGATSGALIGRPLWTSAAPRRSSGEQSFSVAGVSTGDPVRCTRQDGCGSSRESPVRLLGLSHDAG